jgi:hypothetical protein
MMKGTEPLFLLKTIAGVASEIVGFFSAYYAFRHYKFATVVAFSLIAPIVGGIVWQYLCKVNGWPFHLGGSQNEPYGIYAVVWGVVTLLPVVFAVRLVTSEHNLNSIAAVGCWFISFECLLCVVYVGLAGICSLLFYGVEKEYGVRTFITSFGMSHERTEQIIIAIWALSISVIPTFALMLLGGTHTPRWDTKEVLSYAAPSVLTVTLCLLSLSVYFALYDYTNLDQKAQIQGMVAGLAVRFSVFWGLWLSIDIRNLKWVLSAIKDRALQPFP